MYFVSVWDKVELHITLEISNPQLRRENQG